MSNTPRTESQFYGREYLPAEPLVTAEFARTLERELNSAVEALKLCAAVIGSPNDGEWKSVDECNAAFDAATEVIQAAKGEQS